MYLFYVYRYVPAFFLLLCVTSALPRLLWETLDENSKITSIITEQCNLIQLCLAVEKCLKHSKNKRYAILFYMCEFLSVVVLGIQFAVISTFLGHYYYTYGIGMVSNVFSDPVTRTDDMSRLFPVLTICSYQKYSTTNNFDPVYGNCSLPLNNLYEKIFIFLFFFYSAILIFGCVISVYRLFYILVKYLREQYGIPLASEQQMDRLTKCFGNKFLISQLRSNISSAKFEKVKEYLNEDEHSNSVWYDQPL